MEGEVKFDTFTRKIYSVDSSLYQIDPLGVVIPRTKYDIFETVRTAKEFGVPVLPRGAATGITGGCLGEGIVLDTSKYMNHILDINYEEGFAVCEPGVIQDQLNRALAPEHYCLGPDTSTGDRATVGGMVGNNAAGAHSMRYGKMVDNVLSLEMALAQGEVLEFGETDEAAWERKLAREDAEGRIYREVDRVVRENAEEIDARYPKIQRRVSGFNLDEFVRPGSRNLSKLITGSEGTLGIVSEAKVRIARKPRHTGLVALLCEDLIEGLRGVEALLEAKPFSLELIDEKIIAMARVAPDMRGKLSWLQGNPGVILVAEFDGESQGEMLSKLDAFEALLRRGRYCYAHLRLVDKADQKKVWDLRKAGLGLLMAKRTPERAVAFLEDTAVGPGKLADFMAEFRDYIRDNGKEAGFYGHAGVGCLHVRPMIDTKDPADLKLMVRMMEDMTGILKKYGGALSGEHGDGITRSWLNEKMFGPKIYQAFRDIKGAFDPEGRMNPGKVIANQGPLENLKFRPDAARFDRPTQFSFEREGGFQFSVEMCNGNGACRKPTQGLMCPSFQAYGDERHSTRARAQSLNAVMNGSLPGEMFTGKELHDVLDLCLECKGCKSECPSQVDMAKMKSEFLYHYQEANGYSLRSKLFAHVDTVNRIGSAFAPLSNWAQGLPLSKWALDKLGVARERTLPPFSRKRFSKWAAKRTPGTPAKGSKGQVVLFNDTYMEYNYPHLGRSAVAVLEKLGYEVLVPPRACCARPSISKGFLRQAKEKATVLVETLHPYAAAGIPILGLEPSCILTVKDDYPDLIPGGKTQAVASQGSTLDEFLSKEIKKGALQWPSGASGKEYLVHGHCYQKALGTSGCTPDLLKAASGGKVAETDSGCCGMAGSFGYEKEHYAFSLQVGETRLLPAVRASAPGTVVVANGLSCRSQIAHGTGRPARHVVEVLAEGLGLSS